MLVLTHLALVLASAHLNLILETWWPRPVSSAKLEPKSVLRKTSAKKLLRKILTTLDWVTRFLWYLARAARRKIYFCNPGARSAEKIFWNARLGHPFSLVSGNAGTTLGQRWCKKHEGKAIHWHKTQWYSEEKLAKSIFRYFLQKPDVRATFFFV